MSKLTYTLTQIEYVLAIEKHGSFSAAAEACLITQPTLSMQIQKLEESLGVVLFDRSKKPIKVNGRAVPIVNQMKALWLEANKLKEVVEGDATGPLTGELSIGVIPTLAPYLLPLILPHITKALPRLKLEIREMQTAEIERSLLEGETDVGLLALSLESARLQERTLFWEPFSLICAKSHPLQSQKRINPSDLSAEGLWLLQEGHCLRGQVLDICSHKTRKKSPSSLRFESGSLETLKNLIDAVGGYTLIPFLAAGGLKSKTALIPFERPAPAREIGLVSRREHFKSDLIEVFGDHVMSALPATLKQLKEKEIEAISIEP